MSSRVMPLDRGKVELSVGEEVMMWIPFFWAVWMSSLYEVLRDFPGGMRSCLIGNSVSAWVRPWTWLMSGWVAMRVSILAPFLSRLGKISP